VLVGFILIALLAGGYLGWQHFVNRPSAAKPEPTPPVPVISTTLQQRDFPIVLTGIGTVTALNTDGPRPGHRGAR
jgi:membrane fusion protein, multidrug efflux system